MVRRGGDIFAEKRRVGNMPNQLEKIPSVRILRAWISIKARISFQA
jgi:hypothetical protein